jgi:hypothetical protein
MWNVGVTSPIEEQSSRAKGNFQMNPVMCRRHWDQRMLLSLIDMITYFVDVLICIIEQSWYCRKHMGCCNWGSSQTSRLGSFHFRWRCSSSQKTMDKGNFLGRNPKYVHWLCLTQVWHTHCGIWWVPGLTKHKEQQTCMHWFYCTH